MNIITFGSCMSEGVLASIYNKGKSDIQHLNHVIHNRSDYFRDAFIEKSCLPSDKNSLQVADLRSSSEFPGKDMIGLCEFYIKNQSSYGIGINNVSGRSDFISNLVKEKVDLLICDNFMDISSKIVFDRKIKNKYFLFSAAFSSDVFLDNFYWVDYLTADESLSNWLVFFDWFKAFQPSANIVFVPFPSSVHGHDQRESLVRNRYFLNRISSVKIPSVNVLNTPKVTENFLSNANDWCHYSSSYYNVIADAVIGAM